MKKRNRKKPRVVFELEPRLHEQAKKLAKADARKSVSAHAKVVYERALKPATV